MLKIMFMILFANHLVACAWFEHAKNQNFDETTWVALKDVVYDTPGRLYLMAYYWGF